ncbi:MAG: phosphatidylglycerophosphatase A [Hahellaceae bacterium]|jgi:phosphatidylglycerophosphatase A|nr:phosphatidylglycerophosphatase A [Hahellaceae bacterium]
MSSEGFTPSLRKVIRQPVHLLATGLASGLLKPAPGTWGSASAVLVYALFLSELSPLVFVTLIIVAGLLGVLICGRTAADWGVHDHGSIVWDEWVGQWIALIGLASEPVYWLLGFVCFRVLDIWKPGPIGWADKHFEGGVGIMLDDILAGIGALACVTVVRFSVS